MRKPPRLAWLLIWALVVALTVYALTGCSLLQPCPVDDPAARAAEDWRDARSESSDGGSTVTPAETRHLDRDFGWIEDALDEKSAGFSPPATGIPWLDAALGVGGLLLTAAGTHKYTMRKRDKTRAKALEEVKAA